MKKRLISGTLFTGILFFVDLLVCCLPNLDLYRKQLISKTVFNENLILNDYHTMIKYCVVHVFVFLIYVNYVLREQKIEAIVRYKSRKQYYNRCFASALLVSFLFSLLHEAVGWIFIFLYGDLGLLVSHGWIAGNVFQITVSTLFYFVVFLVQSLAAGKMEKAKAQLVTVLFFVAVYYVSVNIIEPHWFPLKDVILLFRLCGLEYSYEQCVYGIIRLASCAAVLLFLFYRFTGKGDVMGHEKG